MVIFYSYVSLPEGIKKKKTKKGIGFPKNLGSA
jgi:hypothetical protein